VGAEARGFFLAVAGNIGVGKTHVSRTLGERLGWPVYYEPVVENPYLDAFYADMSRWAFHLQIYFLSERYQAQKRFTLERRSFIQDRTIYEDAEVFARTLHAQDDMSRTDYDTYRSLFWSMVETLRPPDLIVYLRAEVATCMARIASRGRACEVTIDPAYLERLDEAYATWMAEARDRFDVLEVDTEPSSFLESGIERIEEAVRERAAARGISVQPELP
jgi:deoxyadenosine/deoxycytidine kinase